MCIRDRVKPVLGENWWFHWSPKDWIGPAVWIPKEFFAYSWALSPIDKLVIARVNNNLCFIIIKILFWRKLIIIISIAVSYWPFYNSFELCRVLRWIHKIVISIGFHTAPQQINPLYCLLNVYAMWGANKWTDSMFKKYWRAVTVLILLFLLSRITF